MPSNTGSFSLYVGSIFILLSILSLFIVFYLLKRDIISETKLEKVIDYGKWVIGSVAIVVGGSIISDGFKERDQDVKELEYFDKYVATVTEVEGVEKRYLLCEYFAAVSPDGAMKDSWNRYLKIITPLYDTFKLTKQKIAIIEGKDSLTPKDLKTITVLHDKNAALEGSLLDADPTPVTPTVYIQYGDSIKIEGAKKIQEAINQSGYDAPGVEYIPTFRYKKNRIIYFKSEDARTALSLQQFLRQRNMPVDVVKLSSYSAKVKRGTIELWIK